LQLAASASAVFSERTLEALDGAFVLTLPPGNAAVRGLDVPAIEKIVSVAEGFFGTPQHA
jgi:hypothetical protein